MNSSRGVIFSGSDRWPEALDRVFCKQHLRHRRLFNVENNQGTAEFLNRSNYGEMDRNGTLGTTKQMPASSRHPHIFSTSK